MKKSICFIHILSIFLLFSFCLVNFTSAQEDWRFSGLTANVGKGAFTSGFDITAKFDKGSKSLSFTGNHERVYFIYSWSLPFNISFGASGGFFKNMPWAGPYVIIAPTKFLSFLHWSGCRFGQPEKPDTKIKDFFFTNGFYLKIERFSFGFLWMKFLGEKTFIPGVSYIFPINKNFRVFVGMDYKKSVALPLYRIGVSYFNK